MDTENDDDFDYERHKSTSDIPNGGILEGTLIYRKDGRLKMKNMRMVSYVLHTLEHACKNYLFVNDRTCR